MATTATAMSGALLLATTLASAEVETVGTFEVNGGVWGNPSAWSCFCVPNNAGEFTYAAIIDSLLTCELSMSTAINRFEIRSGATLNQESGFPMTIVAEPAGGDEMFGKYTLVGTHNMNSVGHLTDLITLGGPDSLLTIDGLEPGLLRLSNTTANRIYGGTAQETIRFGPNVTLAGSGQIGINLTRLLNDGTFLADQSTPMAIDPSSLGMTNNGLMVASNGASMVLYSGAYDNAAGIMRAEANSTLRFNAGAVVTGGTVEAVDTGLIELAGGTITADSFSIGANAIAQVVAGSTVTNIQNDGLVDQVSGIPLFFSGTMLNTGQHQMNSVGHLTDLICVSDVTLDGGGSILLTDTTANRIYGQTGVQTLINLNNTIRGSGQIGVNLTTIINGGSIIADQSSTLQIDPNAGGLTNNNLMVARNGGTLWLQSATYDNTLGIIRAEQGSTARFNSGATINGGDVIVESGGLFEFFGSTIAADNLHIQAGATGRIIAGPHTTNMTNDGNVEQVSGIPHFFSGVLENTNHYDMMSVGHLTDFILTTDSSFTGGGTIQLSDTTANRIYGQSSTQILTNVDNTIRGSGQIGVNLTQIVNQADIIADQVSPIRIDPNTGGLQNTGLIVARDGGHVEFYPGSYDNTGGIIRVEEGSTMRFINGSEFTGGDIIAEGGAVFEFAGGTFFGPSLQIDSGAAGVLSGTPTFYGLNNHGAVEQTSGIPLRAAGLINNVGQINISSIGHLTDFICIEDVSFVGGGTILLSDTTANRMYGISGVQTLTNVDNTIEGAGQIGVNLTHIINQGSIIANQANAIDIDPNTSGFINEGLFRMENAANAWVRNGPFTNSGIVEIQGDSLLSRLDTSYLQTEGATIVNGTFTMNTNGVANFTGGTLSGEGTINAAVVNDGATVSPGNSAGTLHINGDYTQTATGALQIELGGLDSGSFDVVTATGSVSLSGVLSVSIIDGFVPHIGDTFAVLTSPGSFSGFITDINEIGLPGGFSVIIVPDDNALVIEIIAGDCPADFDGDETVNVDDLLVLLASWGACPKDCLADIDSDGDVDVDDLLNLLGSWGACL